MFQSWVDYRRRCRIIVTLACFMTLTYGESCDRLSTCSCECSGGVIDLEALASKDGPRYADQKDIVGSGYYKYSYNPCKPFTETTAGAYEDFCHDVAACQIIDLGGVYQYYDTGKQDSVTFYTASGKDVDVPDESEVVIAKYTSADAARQTEVVLVCNTVDDSTAFVAIGELPVAKPTYRFILVSPDCCFVATGLSAGSIMLIVFFSIIFAYIVCMIGYLKFRTKASGKDLIPHREFWVSIPGLIKDGALFVFRRNKSGTSAERSPLSLGKV